MNCFCGKIGMYQVRDKAFCFAHKDEAIAAQKVAPIRTERQEIRTAPGITRHGSRVLGPALAGKRI